MSSVQTIQHYLKDTHQLHRYILLLSSATMTSVSFDN